MSLPLISPAAADCKVAALWNLDGDDDRNGCCSSGKKEKRGRRNGCWQCCVLYILLLGWGLAAAGISYFKGGALGGAAGFLRGRDSFGTTCGLDSHDAHSSRAPPSSPAAAAYDLAEDARDKPHLFYFEPAVAAKTSALRLCVAACPESSGSSADAAAAGLCLDQRHLALLAPDVAAANGIVTSGPHLGCPSHFVGTRTILHRCTPLTRDYAVEGIHIDIIADCIEFWHEAVYIVAAVLVLSALLQLGLANCITPTRLFAATLLSAIVAIALLMTKLVTPGPLAAALGVAGGYDFDEDKPSLDRHVHIVNYWVNVSVAAALLILLVMWMIWLCPSGSRRSISSSRPFLRHFGALCRRRTCFFCLLSLSLVLAIGGLMTGLALGVIAVLGGCEYSPETTNDGKLIDSDYSCSTLPTATLSPEQVLPCLAASLVVWTYLALCRLHASVCSRQVAIDFVQKLKPRRRRGMSAVPPALLNIGQAFWNGLVSFCTCWVQCFAASKVINAKDCDGGPWPLSVAARLSIAARLQAIQVGMDKPKATHGIKTLITLLQTNRKFSTWAMAGGTFHVNCWSALAGTATWCVTALLLAYRHPGVRYEAILAAVAGVSMFVFAGLLFEGVRAGCDTLAVLMLAEEPDGTTDNTNCLANLNGSGDLANALKSSFDCQQVEDKKKEDSLELKNLKQEKKSFDAQTQSLKKKVGEVEAMKKQAEEECEKLRDQKKAQDEKRQAQDEKRKAQDETREKDQRKLQKEHEELQKLNKANARLLQAVEIVYQVDDCLTPLLELRGEACDMAYVNATSPLTQLAKKCYDDTEEKLANAIKAIEMQTVDVIANPGLHVTKSAIDLRGSAITASAEATLNFLNHSRSMHDGWRRRLKCLSEAASVLKGIDIDADSPVPGTIPTYTDCVNAIKDTKRTLGKLVRLGRLGIATAQTRDVVGAQVHGPCVVKVVTMLRSRVSHESAEIEMCSKLYEQCNTEYELLKFAPSEVEKTKKECREADKSVSVARMQLESASCKLFDLHSMQANRGQLSVAEKELVDATGKHRDKTLIREKLYARLFYFAKLYPEVLLEKGMTSGLGATTVELESKGVLSFRNRNYFNNESKGVLSFRNRDDFNNLHTLAASPHLVEYAEYNGAPCVLKHFNVASADNQAGQWALKQFLRTIEALVGKLSHPLIMPVVTTFFTRSTGVCQDDASITVQLPWYGEDVPPDGVPCQSTLKWYIDEKKPTVAAKIELVAKILQALEQMHINEVIHGDIRPENIFLAHDKVQGTWRLVVGNPGVTTAEHQNYAAPEVITDSDNVSCKSDVWSAGQVLLFCFPKLVAEVDHFTRKCTIIDDPEGQVHHRVLEAARKMLQYDPNLRPTAAQALHQNCFSQMQEFFDDVAQQTERDRKLLAEQRVDHRANVAALEQDKKNLDAKMVQEHAEIAKARDALDKLAKTGEETQKEFMARKERVEEEIDKRHKRLEDHQQELNAQKAKLESLKKLATPFPRYWKHQDLDKSRSSLETTMFMKGKLQTLLRESPLHPDGCLGKAGLANATVTKVLRIENTHLWDDFNHRKRQMLQLSSSSRPQKVVVKDCHENFYKNLDPNANEFFLLHGTKPDTATLIAEHGFDERVAEIGGLYGGGCYFAENSCKSHQYTTANPQGEFTMLYCRVLLGDPYLTNTQLKNQRRAPEKPGHPGQIYDSVVASGGTQIHREFIVYDRHQIYPEFLIYYKP